MPFTSNNKIIVLEKVDSTNNYAMAMIQKGEAINGIAVFAIAQTDGKGRRGKLWKTNAGDNIILSITSQMQWLPVSHQFELSVAVALACHDLLSNHIPSGVRIKWPNDIFINDSKAAGILIENVIKGTLWQWAVIGIGVNINQAHFEEYSVSPVSLKQITGNDYDVFQMATALQSLILKRIDELQKGGFQNLLKEYNEKLYARNRLVKLKKQNMIFETTLIGVSCSGQLITDDTLGSRYNFDEVEFRGLV